MKKALIVLLIIVVALGTTGYWYVSRITAVAPPPPIAEVTQRNIQSGQENKQLLLVEDIMPSLVVESLVAELTLRKKKI